MATNTVDHPPRLPEAMGLEAAAKVIGRHPETLRRWIRSGRMSVVNPTREWVVTREEVQKCLTSLE